MLRSSLDAKGHSFERPKDFVSALRDAMTESRDIERLFDGWEQNVATVRELNTSSEKLGLELGFASSLVAHLKSCAIALVKPSDEPPKGSPTLTGTPKASPQIAMRRKIDKSALTLAEPKRFRSKEHLRFVAQHPCLIFGRKPSHAHHIRYAQSKGLGLKVSDEFTVPFCTIHHTENHAAADERCCWEQHNIEPLDVAKSLWRQGRLSVPLEARCWCSHLTVDQ